MNADLSDAHLQIALRRCVSDAKTLGYLFIFLTVLGCLYSTKAMLYGRGQFVVAACGIVLLAPGVLYLTAGEQIRARRSAGGRLGFWAAASHLAGIPLLIMTAVLSREPALEVMLFPATISILFVPALIAFLFSMGRARKIARLLGEPGQGFTVLPAQTVLPVEPSEDEND